MKCEECQEMLVAHVEGLLEADQADRFESHLRDCPQCRAELAELKRLGQRLSARAAAAGPALEAPVMTAIVRQQALKLRGIKMKIGATAAAGVAAAVMIGLWLSAPGSRATAAEVLAQAANATANLRSVHIRCRMRTLPRDNFVMIGLKYDFVRIEMWKLFGQTPKWRVEKPGRAAVMDGTGSTLWIKPDHAARSGVQSGFVGWVGEILDVDKLIDREISQALRGLSELKLTHDTAQDGSPKLLVTVEAKARGDFTNNWLRNKSIAASDNRRVYRFDARTKRLEELKVYVHAGDKEVLVFEVTQIRYDVEVDPKLFALELPKDVIWLEQPQVLPDNARYQKMSPAEAARAFFEACSEEDWDEMRKFWASSGVSERTKQYLGGLKVVKLGEPFRSGRYPGWFVPYQIKLKSGRTKEHRLAVRNDNPAKRYVVDGGI